MEGYWRISPARRARTGFRKFSMDPDWGRCQASLARRDHRKSKFGLRHAIYRSSLALLRDEVRILIFDDPAELEAWQ